MRLPVARGPLSAWLLDHLTARATDAAPGRSPAAPAVPTDVDALADDDLHLALWACYELHYQGFEDVDDAVEWDPDVLAFRAALERPFLAALEATVGLGDIAASDVADELRTRTSADSGPSLSRFIHRHATSEQFAEFVAHRSLYHLKEADPHTWAIPRLRGRAKAAMIEIQADEYGGGRLERMHAELFARLMRGIGLDSTYGAYLDDVPGITLATSNVMSLFGLHRRWRGAAAGHLAAIEMTSSLPNRRYGQGLRRLGGTEAACAFFDEHIEADAVHEQIATHDLCASLAQDQPELAGDIVFGAACGLLLDELFVTHVIDAWAAGRSSLSVREQARAA